MSETPKLEQARSTTLAAVIRRASAEEPRRLEVFPALAIIQRATRLASTLDWANAEPLEENDRG